MTLISILRVVEVNISVTLQHFLNTHSSPSCLTVFKSMDFVIRLPGLESQPHHFL